MDRTRGTRLLALPCGVLAVLGLAACAPSQAAPATDVAQQFYAAVAAGDGAHACSLLAPTTAQELESSTDESCDQAIVGQDIPQVTTRMAVHVFGAMAQLHYPEDTAFLTRFRTGWKVLAVGCKPAGAHPYDCQVKGS